MTEVEQTPLLGGRYRLGERIGTGGMADVRKGVDVRLGREVAVKVLRADLARDPSFQARFRREAQAAASLNAASIVSVYDTGEDPHGVPYIVMEFVAGRTLRDVVHEEGRLLPQRALELTADICAALEVAHGAGIVHRDIKPANVMLTPSGQVKVMDFGIARAATDTTGATQTAAVIGTAAYLSPEQARGDHVDARSDLYSTGCLLFELVSGVPPFTGDSPVAVAYQHVREEPEPPSAFDGTLPPEVDAVVLKAMEKDPAQRYQSAAEMRADLLRARAGQAVVAPPVVENTSAAVVPTTVLADPRRRRTARGLVLAAFLVLLVAIGDGDGAARAQRGRRHLRRPRADARGSSGSTSARPCSGWRRTGCASAASPPASTRHRSGACSPRRRSRTSWCRRAARSTSSCRRASRPPSCRSRSSAQPRAEAEPLLSDRKLSVANDVVARDGFHAAGTVLAVAPAPGSQVRAGSAVTLTVATGRVELPDVEGRSQDEAVEALTAAGFDVRVELQYVDGPAGRVLSQSPDAGRREAGQTVVLAVSQTIPPPAPPAAPDCSAERRTVS